MYEFTLKNGEKGKVELFGFTELSDLCSEKKPVYESSIFKIFKNFTFLGPSLPKVLIPSQNEYSSSKNLSTFEIQDSTQNEDHLYYKILVAKVKEEVAGVLVLTWMKNRFPFWRYYLSYIDVRTDLKNQGVGTNLVKALDKSSFLSGKVLEITDQYEEEGKLYIKKVFEKELKAKNYIIIPSRYQYCFLDYKIPDKRYEIVNSEVVH